MTDIYRIYRERISRCNLSTYLSWATGWTMRVWRHQSMESSKTYEPGRTMLDPDIVDALGRFVQVPCLPLELAQAILALPGINAVEIIDLSGFGEVLYEDWP